MHQMALSQPYWEGYRRLKESQLAISCWFEKPLESSSTCILKKKEIPKSKKNNQIPSDK